MAVNDKTKDKWTGRQMDFGLTERQMDEKRIDSQTYCQRGGEVERQTDEKTYGLMDKQTTD